MTYKKLVENMVKAKALRYMSDVLEKDDLWLDLEVTEVKVEWHKELEFWNWDVEVKTRFSFEEPYKVGGYIDDDNGEVVITTVEDRNARITYHKGWINETEYYKDLKRFEVTGAA